MLEHFLHVCEQIFARLGHVFVVHPSLEESVVEKREQDDLESGVIFKRLIDLEVADDSSGVPYLYILHTVSKKN